MDARSAPASPLAADLSLVDALVQLSFLIQGVLAAAAGAEQMSVTQLRLLGILRDRTPGVLQLAAALGLEKSSVTGLLDRAERRGLVRRQSAPPDGRAVHVHLTDHGRSLVDEVARSVGVEIDRLLAAVPERARADLRRTASRILRDAGRAELA